MNSPTYLLALVAQLPSEDSGVIRVDAAVYGVGALRDCPQLRNKDNPMCRSSAIIPVVGSSSAQDAWQSVLFRVVDICSAPNQSTSLGTGWAHPVLVGRPGARVCVEELLRRSWSNRLAHVPATQRSNCGWVRNHSRDYAAAAEAAAAEMQTTTRITEQHREGVSIGSYVHFTYHSNPARLNSQLTIHRMARMPTCVQKSGPLRGWQPASLSPARLIT